MRLLLTSSLLASAAVCLADSIYLIEGTVYKDCRIMYSTDDEIVIEYPDAETPSIRREVTLKKKDIYKHLQSTQEEIEAQQLEKRLRRAPMAVKASVTKTLSMYEDFMKRYPESSYAMRLKKLYPAALATLQELEMKEKEAEAQGKAAAAPQPVILTPEQQERYQFDIDANKLYQSMLEYAKQRQEAKAMQMFSKLEKMQGAACFPKAYLTAVRLTGILESRWQKQLNEAQNSRSIMERKVSRMTGAKKVKAAQYLREQTARQMKEYQAISQAAREKGYRWFTPPADNIPALQYALSYADQERRRMSKPLDKDSPAGKASVLIRDFWDAVDDNEIVDAKTALTTLKGMGHHVCGAAYTDPMSKKFIELQTKVREQIESERLASRQAAQQEAAESRAKRNEDARERALIEKQKRLEAFEKSRKAEELAAEESRRQRAERNNGRTLPAGDLPKEVADREEKQPAAQPADVPEKEEALTPEAAPGEKAPVADPAPGAGQPASPDAAASTASESEAAPSTENARETAPAAGTTVAAAIPSASSNATTATASLLSPFS